MTAEQRIGIEILNNLKLKGNDEHPFLCDDDYFFLLSFIIDNPQGILCVECRRRHQYGQCLEIPQADSHCLRAQRTETSNTENTTLHA